MSESDWADPDIQKALSELRAAIDTYRHLKRKTSLPRTTKTARESVVLGKSAELFTEPGQAVPSSDKFKLQAQRAAV